MKKIWIAAVAIALSSSVHAAATEPEARQLAEQYLQETDMQGILATSLHETEGQLDNRVPAAQQAKMHDVLEQIYGWSNTKEELIELVATLYTVPELKAYLAFLATPEGKSFNSKNEEFTRRFGAVIRVKMQNALKDCCVQKKP